MANRSAITERTDRREYETRIAPRGLARILAQKLLHIAARFCVHGGLRVALYRWMGARIAGDVYIGLDCYLDDQFPELIVIEEGVTISFRVTIAVHDDARRIDRLEAGKLEGTVAPVVLKRGCYLGAGCLLLPGVTIGERSIVAAGAVVTRDVPPDKVTAGVPARVIKDVG